MKHLIRFVLAFVMLTSVAYAEPKFGGCLSGGSTCFSPSVSMSLVALSLDDLKVTTGVTPGVGYGVTWKSDQWYSFGFAGYLSFRDTADGQQLVPSLVASFAEYLRFGMGYQLGANDRPFLLIGVGSDFGQAK